MYDVMSTAYRTKLAQAVGGTTSLPKIATIVVGTGGQDANGNPIIPTGNENGLYHQVLSKSAGSPTYPNATTAQFTIAINPADLPAGTNINEAGTIDNSGTFSSISTFYAKATDGTTTMTIQINVPM